MNDADCPSDRGQGGDLDKGGEVLRRLCWELRTYCKTVLLMLVEH